MKMVKVQLGEWGPGPGHYRLDDDPAMQDDFCSIEVPETLVNEYKKVMEDYSQLMEKMKTAQSEGILRRTKNESKG